MKEPEKKNIIEKFTALEIWPDDAAEAGQHFGSIIRIFVKMIARAIIEENTIKEETSSDRSIIGILSGSNISNDQKEKLTLTVTEAANLLGLSRSSTYDAIRSGQIPNIKIGKRILIPKVALSKILLAASSE